MTEPMKRGAQTNRADRKFLEHVGTSRPLAIDINESRTSIDRVAHIFRPSRSVMTAARVSRRPWLLVFERQIPPLIDYLMGYTGGSDMLTQVELRFPSRDAAIAYAGRHKLKYTVVNDRSRRPSFPVRGPCLRRCRRLASKLYPSIPVAP
ncbi:ETC complex I subunit [Sinorhizobium garamanticum]|uniref:ETC complex I subunit n=1 Tax=Sinorhizobium garamanticum TaxID=680247 RepID=A0ABY8DHT2_9HYPH|nr:NADH dehydrogenase ubiquinone Fe-S protein 4 [Sinorhizobium garamanticum]WEX90455.1 ETC complex I subunit [Sinorhizobium garamanticum]